MNAWDQTTPPADDRAERLICRSIDGEITAEEQIELDAILAGDADARALYDEYCGNDRAAAAALICEFDGARTADTVRPRRGLWLATAGAVLTAAAVLALSFVPQLWSGNSNRFAETNPSRPSKASPVMQSPTYVDYRDGNGLPLHRQRDLHRDVIGIPASDGRTIYIFERNMQSTHVAPLAGDL